MAKHSAKRFRVKLFVSSDADKVERLANEWLAQQPDYIKVDVGHIKHAASAAAPTTHHNVGDVQQRYSILIPYYEVPQ